MAWIQERLSNSNIQQIIDQILLVGQLSRQEYLYLTIAILSDYNITEEQRRQINHIFDDVQTGHLKLAVRQKS